MSTYEQYAQSPLGDNLLAQIAQTARDIQAAAQAVSDAQEELTRAQNHLRTLEETTLPSLMETAGQTELTTADGLVVKIADIMRGQPSKENAPAAFAWLRKNGHGGIIKSKIEADLGRASEETIQKVSEAMREAGFRPSLNEGVHWQTLGALVRELMEKGDAVPLPLLGIHTYKKAEVKAKKR